MIDTSAFTKLMPGFDFLNNLMQNAGQAAPAMGHWVAPTLDPAELEKRIGELSTLQFWLDQNARMIGMTIQALEVQRMTLSTLQTMNLPLANLASALAVPKAPAAVDAAAAAPAPAAASTEAQPEADGASPKPAIDPAQWWGALTQQFTQLATKAMQDSREIAERQFAAAADSAKPEAEPKSAAPSTAEPAAKPTAKAANKRA